MISPRFNGILSHRNSRPQQSHRILSCAAFPLTLAAASWVSAAVVAFTADPNTNAPVAFAPAAPVGGAGAFTISPGMLMGTPSGLAYANGSFTYTSAAADIGKTLVINWIADRPFTNVAGNYIDTASWTGSLTVPAGGKFTGFQLQSNWAGLGSSPPNTATVSLSTPIIASGTFDLGASGPAFFDPGGNDNLSQDGTIAFVPSAANQVFQVTFSNAATPPGAAASQVVGASGWVGNYKAGTGGMNPYVPDFYQHQNFVSPANPANPNNGWETTGGACFQVAYSDVFYDLYRQGYTGLFNNDPTAPVTVANPTPWFTAMYGNTNNTADTQASNLFTLRANMAGGSVQAFLDKVINNKQPNVVNGTLPKLISNVYYVGTPTPIDRTDPSVNRPAGLLLKLPNSGQVYYTEPDGKTQATTGQGVSAFTNFMIKNTSGELLYNLRNDSPSGGTAAPPPVMNGATPPVPTGQRLWWSNNAPNVQTLQANPGYFHEVAVAGIDSSNADATKYTMSIADPDTNNGSAPSNGGWASGAANFPGAPPAGAGANAPPVGSFGLMTPSNAPLPTAAATYAAFQINAKGTVSSANSPQYNGTYVNNVAAVYSSVVKGIGAKPVVTPAVLGAAHAGSVSPATSPNEETTISLDLPVSYGAVDQIFIEPSTQAVDPSTDPIDFSLTVPNDPGSDWSEAFGTADPFGNPLADDGVYYNLDGGADPLIANELGLLNIETTSDFSASGYDVLLHFAGDPTDQWLPEMIGGTGFDPSDVPLDQTLLDNVPEPTALALVVFTGAPLVFFRRRRNKAMQTN